MVDGNLTGTGRKAVRVTGFCPRGVSCGTEGKLGVGAGAGEAGAGRDKQWEERAGDGQPEETGKRSRKAAVTFAWPRHCESAVPEDGGAGDGYQREQLSSGGGSRGAT